MWIRVVYVANGIILCSSALLSMTGIILLHNLKQPYTNQRTLLISFGSSELFYSLSKFIVLVIIQTAGPDSRHRIVAGTIWRTSWFVYYLMMALLLLDRFISCFYPIHYRVLFSKRRTIIASLIAWIVGLSTAIFCPIAGFDEFRIICRHADFGFSVFLLLTLCFVYAAISWRLRISLGNGVNDRFLKVVCFLVGTFVIFLVIPDIVVYFISKNNEDTLSNIWVRLVYTIGDLNFFIDPMIYIFGYPLVKAALKEKASKLIPCRSGDVLPVDL